MTTEILNLELPDAAALVARGTEGARLADLVNRTRAAYEAANVAYSVGKGATIRVIRGRKVPIGTVGRCIWHGETRFGWRVGLADAAGTVHFTAEHNVAVDVDGDTAADLYDLHVAKLAARAALDAWVAAGPPARNENVDGYGFPRSGADR